jgi:hypothetical protein
MFIVKDKVSGLFLGTHKKSYCCPTLYPKLKTKYHRKLVESINEAFVFRSHSAILNSIGNSIRNPNFHGFPYTSRNVPCYRKVMPDDVEIIEIHLTKFS